VTADDEYVDHFRARVLQDALTEAIATYWLTRAERFDRAMHRPGDFRGRAGVEALAANNAILAEAAQACRNRASLSPITKEDLTAIRVELATARAVDGLIDDLSPADRAG